MKKFVSVILISAMFTGCATQPLGADYQPIVDLKDRDQAKYQADLSDCRTYAHQAASAADKAAAGAVAGAIFGAILMSAAGVGHQGRGAAVGALSGAAGGAVEGERDQRKVLTNCLVGRGYSVLG